MRRKEREKKNDSVTGCKIMAVTTLTISNVETELDVMCVCECVYDRRICCTKGTKTYNKVYPLDYATGFSFTFFFFFSEFNNKKISMLHPYGFSIVL